ncbi:hypothetical protein ABKV19_004954 [Rosa sericea]
MSTALGFWVVGIAELGLVVEDWRFWIVVLCPIGLCIILWFRVFVKKARLMRLRNWWRGCERRVCFWMSLLSILGYRLFVVQGKFLKPLEYLEICIWIRLWVDKGIEPNIYSYNIVINGLCKNGMLCDARIVMGLMARNNISPYTVCF